MRITAQQIFRELDSGKWRPFYLIVGEEPYQTSEIVTRIRAFFLRGDGAASGDTFRYEAWDAEGVDGAALRSSLEILPGLFDAADSVRCVVCRRFEKASAATLEALESYFRDPNPTTSFVVTAAKVDKRKAWVKAVEERGALIEVAEPQEREWPRWQGYFEKKLGKTIEPEAWALLLEGAGRSLSLLWGDLERMAVFAGESPGITREAVAAFQGPAGIADIFAFADDVVARRASAAMQKHHTLLRHGESEIKLLAILVRAFRQVASCVSLAGQGITDAKAVAARIGVPPFVVGKIQSHARGRSEASLNRVFSQLAECDYRLKLGEGSLAEHFLVPYFATSP
jgi:DNA polymerase-3 subunit delta